MKIHAYPPENCFLEEGIRSYLNNLPVRANRLDECLFLLLNKNSISEIIIDRVIENTPYYRVFILTCEKFMPLALYYLNAYPGKVSILSRDDSPSEDLSSAGFTTSITHLKEVSSITPGEYRALALTLSRKSLCRQVESARKKVFYYHRSSALQKMGLKRINALFI
ncbi:hypothetical protein ACLHDD_03305 [Pantoea sp. NSTU24]|uniref:hypothetical protein n=1 Tax=Pantoea sp. NSTU24 TaxID=3391144 RepID=UPI003D031A01